MKRRNAKLKRMCSKLLAISVLMFAAIDVIAAEMEQVTLQLKWVHKFHAAGYYAAVEQGFYAAEGLEVEIRERDKNKAHVRSVVDGDAEYGVADAGLVVERMRGAPVVLLRQIFQHSPLVLITLKDSGLTTPFMLRGRRVMVDENAHANVPILAMLIDTLGSPEQVKMVQHSFSTQELIEGKVVAVSGYLTTMPFELKQQGIEINVIDPRDYGIDFYGDNLYTTDAEIRDHPQRVDKMIHASLKGWQYAMEHPEEIIELILTKYNPALNREQLRDQARLMRQMILPDEVPLGTVAPRRYFDIAQTHQLAGVPLIPERLTGFIYQQPLLMPKTAANELVLTEAERIWLTQNPVLRLGFDIDRPPVEYADKQGRHQGLSAEYLRSIADSLGIHIEPVTPQNGQTILGALKSGQVDLFAAIMATPQRREFLIFSKPYLSFPLVVVTDEQSPYVGSLQQLSGKKVAVVADYSSHEILRSRHPELKLHAVQDTVSGLMAVKRGDSYAFVGSLASIGHIISREGLTNLKVTGETPYRIEFSIAVPQDQPVLAGLIQKALDAIPEEQRNAIYNNWISIRYEQGVNYRILWQVFAVVAPLFAVFIYWNRRLAREVVQRKQAEKELKTAIRELTFTKFTFDNAPDAIEWLDSESAKMVYVNEYAAKLLGCSREELLQMDVFDFDLVFNQDAWPEFRTSLRQQGQMTFESIWQRKDGGRLPVEISARSLTYDGKEYFLAFIRDIREKKQALEELQAAKKAADAANQAKSEFLANMSHEIRTPMNAVLGFAEILKSRVKDPTQQRHVEAIYTSGRALLSLIDDILDLSKVEAGKLELQYGAVSIRKLADELNTVFAQKVQDKGLQFILNVSEDVPEEVLLDEVRLRQVLINLIGNAFKFTDHGYIRLNVECVFTEKTHSQTDLTLKVCDSGIGIAEEQREKIFGAFEQAKGQNLKQYGGTGLGLAICKRLVELMQGSLTVESEPGNGSDFIIHLPGVEVAAGVDESDLAVTDVDHVRFEPATILIVDDIDYNRDILRTFLESQPFEILEAEDGKMALTQAFTHHPDLILLDMKMPVMDGYEVSAQLKQDELLSQTPLVAVTAFALKQDEEIISQRCDGYLRKPISRQELITKLMEFLPYSE